MSLESEIENQPFAVRRVVLASGWRQGLTSLFTLKNICNIVSVLTSTNGMASGKRVKRSLHVNKYLKPYWNMVKAQLGRRVHDRTSLSVHRTF